jgi:hypothetical protein
VLNRKPICRPSCWADRDKFPLFAALFLWISLMHTR